MLRIALPLLILLAGMGGAVAIVAHRPALEAEAPAAAEPPRVQVLTARPETLRLDVHSQGIATPRTEIDLVAEVSGKVVRLHPAFAAGGFFQAGEVLVAIDSRDYDHAIVGAQGRLAEARRFLAQEEAAAQQAQGEWRALGEGEPTPLALHVPQVAEARAKLAAAEAELEQARLQRARCELRAPFAGRVREKQVGTGQYLMPGDKLARLYSVDAAEIRLPLTLDQTAWLDLPMAYPDGTGPRSGPAVTLTARVGGIERRWQGRIVRTEGALDPDTGLLHAVAEVADPYRPKAGQSPLLAGTFVQAEIEGRPWPELYALPQGALNAAGEAWLVDGTGRLRQRRLDVLRTEPGRVLVRSGLQAGERVVLAGVDAPVEGMAVRPETE
jgi:multidrug efflux system membrane fusion protein